MKLAIFLDVDKTLTIKNIQEYFADELNCRDEYDILENNFQNETISSKEFGLEIISLYAEKGLNEYKAKQCALKVELQPWTNELLALNANETTDVYLVSTGPSYYIDKLAEDFNIRKENVLCSRYHFEGSEQLISRCDPQNQASKANFVSRTLAKKSYKYSIGVGDHPQMDAFINACSIGFLIEVSDDYFFAPNIQAIIEHAHTIQRIDSNMDMQAHTSKLDLRSIRLVHLKRLTLGSGGVLIGIFMSAVGIGVWVHKIWSTMGG